MTYTARGRLSPARTATSKKRVFLDMSDIRAALMYPREDVHCLLIEARAKLRRNWYYVALTNTESALLLELYRYRGFKALHGVKLDNGFEVSPMIDRTDSAQVKDYLLTFIMASFIAHDAGKFLSAADFAEAWTDAVKDGRGEKA